MSPKSTIPVIRPSSSTSALSMVRSRVDALGPQRRPARDDHRLEPVEDARRRQPAGPGRGCRAASTGSSGRAGCPRASSAGPSGGRSRAAPGARRAVISPQSPIAASLRASGSLRPWPGRTSYRRTKCDAVGRLDRTVPVGRGAVAAPGLRRERSAAGRRGGSGRPGARAGRPAPPCRGSRDPRRRSRSS